MGVGLSLALYEAFFLLCHGRPMTNVMHISKLKKSCFICISVSFLCDFVCLPHVTHLCAASTSLYVHFIHVDLLHAVVFIPIRPMPLPKQLCPRNRSTKHSSTQVSGSRWGYLHLKPKQKKKETQSSQPSQHIIHTPLPLPRHLHNPKPRLRQPLPRLQRIHHPLNPHKPHALPPNRRNLLLQLTAR